MKRSVIFLILMSLLITGCSSSAESSGAVSDSLQFSDTLPDETLEPEETETSAESAPPASTATTPATTTTTAAPETEQTTTEATPETAPQTTVAAPAAPPETAALEETEPPVEENKYDLPVFIEYTYNHPVTTFGATKEYLLVTVIPEKIYWNDPKRFDAEEGSSLNILIPAVMYDTMKNADSTVLHFNSYNSFPNVERTLRFLPKSDDNNELTYDNVIRGDCWDIDDMFIIKDGVLAEFEYTEEMRKFLLGQNYDCGMLSSIMLDYYPDRFYYGMTIDEFDTFFDNTHRKIVEMEAYAEEVRKELDDDSYNVGCDLVSYSYFLDGTEMRVRLA